MMKELFPNKCNGCSEHNAFWQEDEGSLYESCEITLKELHEMKFCPKDKDANLPL
jgi:hypothetical protein